MSAMSDYLENKLIDPIFRGQTYSFPSTLYFALFTAGPSDAGGGTEVTGAGYARATKAATTSAFSGTQSADATAASSGTEATTRNIEEITFPAPLGDWGTVSAVAIYDAATGGNMLFWAALKKSKIISAGGAAPKFPPGSFGAQMDN